MRFRSFILLTISGAMAGGLAFAYFHTQKNRHIAVKNFTTKINMAKNYRKPVVKRVVTERVPVPAHRPAHDATPPAPGSARESGGPSGSTSTTRSRSAALGGNVRFRSPTVSRRHRVARSRYRTSSTRYRVIRRTVTSSRYDPKRTIEHAIRSMATGNIAFNVPKSLRSEDTAVIQLALSLNKTIRELKQHVTESGSKLGKTVRVSNRMVAKLSGQNFHITEITPTTQVISEFQPTDWRWEIKPKSPGKHSLYLSLSAYLVVDGESTPRTVRTFTHKINIHVDWRQKAMIFMSQNMEWLWATVLLPLGGMFFGKRKDEPTV